MFPGIRIIPRMSFSKARDRLIRLGLTPHEAVWVLLHDDGKRNHKCNECQFALRAAGLAELFMCNNSASEHYLHIFVAGHPACNRYEAKLTEKGRRKLCAGQ